MRKEFAQELLKQAKKDKDIILVTADLGWGLWDDFREQLPDQFYNVGASEQAGAGICVGLALEGKKPYFYSITTFLLYRCFETIRTYINHEKLNVKLIGSGRNKDYAHDGISHWSDDAFRLFDISGVSLEGESYLISNGILDKVRAFWPDNKEEIPNLVTQMVEDRNPMFLSLRR